MGGERGAERGQAEGNGSCAYRCDGALVRLLRDYEQTMDGKPVENRLYPRVALGDSPITNQRAQLFDDPCAARVQSLYVVCTRAVSI